MIMKSTAQSTRSGRAMKLIFSPKDENILATGGVDSLRIWRVLAELDCNKYSYEEINCRNTAKHISALEFSKDGKILFFATKSGQIGQVDVEKSVLISILNSKFENLRLGSITLLSLVKSQSENSKINSKNDHELIVTCTNGSIKAFTLECEDTSSKRYEIKNLKHKNHNIDNDYVNSICHRRNSVLFGTKNGQVIIFDSDLDEKPQAVRENFLHSIKALEFPNQTDEILMIAAGRKIVLIYLPDFSLKCEIQVSNCDCEISKFSPDGSLILSGWSDGTVRAFTPKSGKEWFIIENAHKDSVTQLAVASEMDLIISGGADGLVRLWEVFSEGKTKTVPRLKHSLHAHRDTISSIEMSHNNECCLTASHDGTCIIWSLKTLSAQKVMFTNAIFKAALFEPITLSQILTCSSDGMLIFWQCGSGEKIREIKAVDGSINDVKFLKENNKEIELFKKLEISYEKDNINNEKEIQEIFSNQKFVTVDSLKYLKVWSYKSGAVLTSSSKHSAKIKRMAVNSKGSMIVTGCEDGSIYIWKMK
ncbi:MAG: Cilia- and flagella-associated protein 52 [Paramarteilia canceri]